jgi:DNA-binding NtrC family response regulator
VKVKKILIIDEDLSFLKELSSYMKKLHFTITACADYTNLNVNNGNELPDLITLNPISLTLTTEECLGQIKQIYPGIPIVIVTYQKNYDVIIQAMHYGVIDYIMKPTNIREMHILVHRIVSNSSISLQIRAVQNVYKELIDAYEQQLKYSLVSGSPEMMRIVDSMAYAQSKDKMNVFITGERGVGKESIARGIYAISKRRANTFISFDCSSVSPLLLESELFGHSRNTFTGMMEDKTGILEAAKGGTLYLEAISEIPVAIQEKLFNAIKNEKFKKKWSDKSITLDVRIISSSYKDLNMMIEKGAFLSSLFELMNQYQIDMLPLRERKEDILLLAKHFAKLYAEVMQRSEPQIDQGALQLLLKYTYPNNVTELKMLIRKAMVLSEKEANVLYKEDFPDLYIDRTQSSKDSDWKVGFQPLDILDETEKIWLVNALKFYHNNKTHVAKALHITRQSLNRRIEKHGIELHSEN